MLNPVTNITSSQNTITVSLSGELDAAQYDLFCGAVTEAYNRNPADVVLDFKDVMFIDSTIMGGVIKLYKLLSSDGRKLKIINASPRIKKMFEICNITTILEIE